MGKSERLAALAAACCILLSGCSISAQERYERGQFYFGAGDYETAEMIFRELGDYSNSEKYSLYAAAHQAMRLGKWELAEANLKLIAPFASSAWCLQYIDAAREAEQGALDKALRGAGLLSGQRRPGRAAEKRDSRADAGACGGSDGAWPLRGG